ncbi:MAG: hypothetical protein IT258_17710 [Saprospiraceae bacterium]|nr:hypothetical protein [Saprospiraceae bacterium]
MKKFFVPFVALLLLGTISTSAQSTAVSPKPQSKPTTTAKATTQSTAAPQTALANKPTATNATTEKSNAQASNGKPKKAHHLLHKKNAAQASAGTPDQTRKRSKSNKK